MRKQHFWGGLKNYGICEASPETVADLNRLKFSTVMIDEGHCMVFNVPINEMIYQVAAGGKNSFTYSEVVEGDIVETRLYEKKDASRASTADNPFVVKSTVFESASSQPEVIRKVDKAIAEWRDHPIRCGSGETFLDESINGNGKDLFKYRKGIYEHIQRALCLND